MELPGGTVTFLLTDVEGSSRLWESDSAAAAAALNRRQEIISKATARHDGVLPVEQGEGDSSVSVFSRGSDAAACAVEIQRLLGSEPWPSGVRVRVRMALHTGEAELRDGTYQGAALNRCARIRALGHGGQILLSQATYEVLVDGVADGVVLRDLGVYRLRDLARPERVWQLCDPDLPDVFPPLQALDAVANNLPAQLTSFVGRETELDAITTAVGEHRLVTLTGAGGSGKTRLALQLAAGVGGDHPDGVWWIDLAPLTDASLVAAAVAGVLGVREFPGEPMVETLVHFLSERRTLVILDNCEHLIDACATLATRLIQGCPSVTLVATSREPLHVDGETIWPVSPLSLPTADDDSWASSEAVRLFGDRARAAKPSFALGPDTVGAVAQICTRLDGIPLAIELAAARTRLLNVDEIAAGLTDRFHLLTGGARTALPRQRTLESSVDWSHDLLDDAERTVFRRLAVFAGTFDIEGAETVCGTGDIGRGEVLDVLSSLVDRSLVQVADVSGAQTRYRLLETLRDYARHRLADAGEAEATRDRHLSHYLELAARAATGLEGPDLVRWLARVDVELDNLRAALDWSLHTKDRLAGQRLVGQLCLYWFARSELAVGRDRLAATLETAANATAERCSALTTLCIVGYRAGEMARAAEFGDEALALARQLGDRRLLGRALHTRAWVRFWGQADRFTAWSEFEEATRVLRAVSDPVFAPLNAAMYGWSLVYTSEEPRARALLDEALELASRHETPHARCYAHLVFGQLEFLEGAFEPAVAHLVEALRLSQEIGDHYPEFFSRGFLAYALALGGRLAEAREHAEAGLATALDHRSLNGECLLRGTLGMLALADGDPHTASTEFEAAFSLYSQVFPALAAFPRANQAQAARARSCPDDAAELALDATRLARERDAPMALGWALTTLAAVRRAAGDVHDAESLCHEALDVAHAITCRFVVCEALDSLGGCLLDESRGEDAARLLGAANASSTSLGAVRFPTQQATFDADVAAARSALGDEGFEEAWAEGSRLSLDEAVAYARRGRGKRKRPSHGWPSLTPTEVQIVELVAEGLTNPQIGERLFISRRTVQTHLGHVFTKLGVSTRAELAATSAQRRVEAG